jgi:hypothetical protein
VIVYEGPAAGPGCRRCLTDVVPQGQRPGQGLRVDHGRALQRRHLRAQHRHVSPRPRREARSGWWRTGIGSRIDIPARTIALQIDYRGARASTRRDAGARRVGLAAAP